jgi:Ca-activated chloride channel homolog
MKGVFFEIDYWAIGLAILFLIALVRIRRWQEGFAVPQLFFSDLKDISAKSPSWRTKMAWLPKKLAYGALASFLLALIDPHFLLPKERATTQVPTEGIAIYLLLDRSGSMNEMVRTSIAGSRIMDAPKIGLLRTLTAQFIQGNPEMKLGGRPDDLIGMIAFARVPDVLVPLTLDHSELLQKLAKLQVVSNPDDDGTATGYAIYKATNIFAATRYFAEEAAKAGEGPAYNIKSNIIILVTDGFPDPSILDKGNPLRTMDIPEAAEYAKKYGVRIYVVIVDPSLESAQYGPQRRQMEAVTKVTGGKFYLMNAFTGLDQIYADIDKLEKSRLTISEAQVETNKDKLPNLYRRVSLYPYLIALGMLLLLASVVLEATIFRRIP